MEIYLYNKGFRSELRARSASMGVKLERLFADGHVERLDVKNMDQDHPQESTFTLNP